MKRTIAGLLIAAGLFVPAALGHAPAAMASGEYCGLGAVNVTGNAFHHSYDYTMRYRPYGQDQCQTLYHVKATYDTESGTAYGAINRPGESNVEEAGTWNCPVDPWSSDSPVGCTSDLPSVFVFCPAGGDPLDWALCRYQAVGDYEPASAFILEPKQRDA